MTQPLIGKTLGDYRIVRELGRGGMGVVYEAVHDRVGQRIAIKTLSEELGQHLPYKERFLREAIARSKVSHEGLVKIFGCGEDPGGTVFLLMELLEGQSLRKHLDTESDHRLPLPQALRIALEVAMSLEALHRAGVVHRDLKPSNIMIVSDSAVHTGLRTKLLDFGIAKFLNMPDMPTLSGGSAPGTPTYMSPEQCRGDASLDGRSDVYALGILLYEMLCGRPPFTGEPEQLLLFHVAQAPQSLRQRNGALPQAIDALVLPMLRKRPAERPKIADVIRELQHLLEPGQSGRMGKLARVSGILFARWFFMSGLLLLLLALAELVYYVKHHKLWLWSQSEMALIQGSTITLGSTEREVSIAFDWAKRSGCADCPLSLYEREFPQKQVTVSSFYMDRHEVTNAQYVVWLNQLHDQNQLESDPAGQLFSLHSTLQINIHPDYGYSGIIYQKGRFEIRVGMANRPVTQVTWDGARSYCQQYGKRFRLRRSGNWQPGVAAAVVFLGETKTRVATESYSPVFHTCDAKISAAAPRTSVRRCRTARLKE